MSVEEQIAYHELRARREFDQSRAARSPAAARAHLQLSSLHSDRLRDLQGRGRTAQPPMMMD